VGKKTSMRPFTTLARSLVAAPFVVNGIENLRNPGPRAEQIAPVMKPLADRMDWLPTKDPESLVRLQGTLSLGAGALLTLGRFRRLSTLLLAAQLVPVLLTEHHYWTEDDPERRLEQRSQLLKSASLFGALLLVATEPRRRPRVEALRRRAHDARVKAGAEARHLRRQTASELKHTRKEAASEVREARRETARSAR
jgi:uncharacterized membrane protein YphA (DoxX/SURF4 family)